MKITLDLTDLVGRGALTPAEAERLKGLASQETGSVGVNILLAFGIVAVVLGVGALVPSAITAVVLGAALFALGMGLSLTQSAAWMVLARISLTVGALVMGAGIVLSFDGWPPVVFALAVGLAVAAVLAHSGLLATIAVLTVSSALSAATGYYVIPESALSVGVFSLLALILFLVSLRVPPVYERLAVIGARTAVLLVNFGFFLGSLGGDQRIGISALTFTIGWAVVLIVVGVWAMSANRRWVVNIAAVFGAVHFFVQWFVYLGANPFSILGGGLLVIGFGMALLTFNRRGKAVAPAPAQ